MNKKKKFKINLFKKRMNNLQKFPLSLLNTIYFPFSKILSFQHHHHQLQLLQQSLIFKTLSFYKFYCAVYAYILILILNFIQI